MIINNLLKLFAVIGLIILSPIIIISLILILIEDGSPAIFRQDRLGKDKKIFRIYKIRTMYNETQNAGTHEVSKSQYLKVGGLLRKLKIDELPQIFNYIKGDINLIGPRPGLPSQAMLTKYRDGNDIYTVVPGISGLSQVLGFDMSNPKVLADIDKLYLEKKSIRLDITIFIATFFMSFRNKLAIRFENEILEYTQEQK